MIEADRKIRFGIIGCGQIVQSVHMPVWETLKSAELVAFCDSSPATIESVTRKYRNARKYTDVDIFLEESSDLDFVVLATPGNSHLSIGEKILNRGLHLLCEKPLALNESDANRLYTIAEDKGLTLTPIQNYKYRNTVERALTYARGVAIGDIESVSVRCRSGDLSKESSIWRRGEKEQRVLLFDFSIHFVQLALQIAGNVLSLQFVDSRTNQEGLQYVAFGVAHENGARSLFELMLNSSSSKNEIEVIGQNGAFSLDFFPHGFRILPNRDNPLHRGKGDFIRLASYARSLLEGFLPGRLPDRAIPHHKLFEAFLANLKGYGENPVSKDEVLPTIALLDQVAEHAY